MNDRRILVVDADPAFFDLIAEWLEGEGFTVVGIGAAGRIDLIVVDVPFARPRPVMQTVAELAQRHRGAPVLLLSSSFFPGIERCGPLAGQLGVAGVLPKPVGREALLSAVRGVLGIAA